MKGTIRRGGTRLEYPEYCTRCFLPKCGCGAGKTRSIFRAMEYRGDFTKEERSIPRNTALIFILVSAVIIVMSLIKPSLLSQEAEQLERGLAARQAVSTDAFSEIVNSALAEQYSGCTEADLSALRTEQKNAAALGFSCAAVQLFPLAAAILILMKQTRGIWLLERAAMVTCVSSAISLTVLDAWYAAVFIMAVFFTVAFSERKLFCLALKAECRDTPESLSDKMKKYADSMGWKCAWCGRVNRGVVFYCKYCGELTPRARTFSLPDDFTEESMVSDDVPTMFKDGE